MLHLVYLHNILLHPQKQIIIIIFKKERYNKLNIHMVYSLYKYSYIQKSLTNTGRIILISL